MHDLDGRGQTVGGAGCVGDNVVDCGVVLVFVHADDACFFVHFALVIRLSDLVMQVWVLRQG